MIRTFLDFAVKAGHAEALATEFERLAILDTSVAQPGCTSAEMSVSEDGTTVTVTATWDSPDAYASWTSRGVRSSRALPCRCRRGRRRRRGCCVAPDIIRCRGGGTGR